MPIARKQIQVLEKDRKKTLKALEREKRIFAEAEAYLKTNNYGEILSIVFWTDPLASDGKEIERHVAITTDGIVILNQPIFKLKKPFITLTTKGYPPEKVIDYNNPETYSGLIPFELPVESLLRGSAFRTNPFFFEMKVVKERSESDNPWITVMTGKKDRLLIHFDRSKLETSIFSTETPEKMRVIEIPFWRGSPFSISDFNNLLNDINKKLDEEEKIRDPQTVQILQNRYCKKTRLEKGLKELEKQISTYPTILLKEQRTSRKSSRSSQIRNKKAIVPETKKEGGNKIKEETRKTKSKLVVWDTSHYELLRFESQITEILKLIKETTGLNLVWLKGNWKQELLADKNLFAKTMILVIAGMGSQGKLSKKEVKTISKFVEEGGNLLLSSPQFPGEDINLIAKIFNASFKWNKLKDQMRHEGKYEDHVLISNFQKHSITEGVKTVCFGDYGGFPIEISGNKANPIAFSDKNSDPSKATVLAVAKYGEGKSVLFSSSTTFQDKYLNMYDNRKLAQNIFTYLSKPATAPSPEEPAIEKPIEKPIEETCLTTEKEPISISTESETIQEMVTKEFSSKKEKPRKRQQSKPIQPVVKPKQEALISPKSEEEKEKAERPALGVDEIEQRIDLLDEKLALGEIDETTYDLERFKLKCDIEGLKQLLNSGSINLEKYMEATENIDQPSTAKGNKKCPSCQSPLFGIESFCPHCGEKLE